jgi:hypothetical protein
MPLTKIRYNMLDADVTTAIKNEVTSSGAGSPLVFATSGSTNTLNKFKVGGTDKDIRSISLTANGLLEIVLASFSPTFTAAASPSASLNWDVPATGFTVNVTNPADYTSEYIDAVASIAAVGGTSVYATLAGYSAASKSDTPAGGISWTQAFTTAGSSYIRSASTSEAGGSASGRLAFTYNAGAGSLAYTGTPATVDFSVSWETPAASISLAALTGKTFLDTYTGSSFTPAITNIGNVASNCVYTVSATNATNPGVKAAGDHAITFTTPIHKTNASATTTKVSLSAKISRPSTVTGTAYEVTLATVDSATVNTTASFTYPSFWRWTANKETIPTRADCVTANGFDATVTVLADQVKAFSQMVTNSEDSPRAFWFAVRASASQPASFKTGSSSSLLSDVTKVTSTVALAPDSAPDGYTAETYNLYGITLQPGQTYVSIS